MSGHDPAHRPTRSGTQLLKAALLPGTAGDLARLRRSEVTLAGRTVGPMVVAVLGVGAKAGASTLAALIAQCLAAMAPGRVAMLDADGTQQAQRGRLGADGSGDLAQLLSSPHLWRSRRAVHRHLAHGGSVPLLATAVDQAWSIPPEQVETAIRLLRHRFPCVVVDLHAFGHEVAARVADQIVVVGRLNWTLSATSQWLRASRPQRSAGSVLTVTVGAATSPAPPEWVDLVFPADAALGGPGPVRLADAELATQASVEELLCKLSITWA